MEVSANEIILRVGSRWVRFTAGSMQYSNQAPVKFSLNEDGTVILHHDLQEEMDFAAERIAREMMQETP